MNAHSNKLNQMRLPCPRCHAPASIDARECVCGYKFVADHSPQIAARMPDLDKVVPGFTSSVHKFPERINKTDKFTQPEIKETVVFAIPEPEVESVVRTAKPETVAAGHQRIIVSEQPVSTVGLTTVVSQEPAQPRAVWFGRGLKRTLIAMVAAAILTAFGLLTFYLSDILSTSKTPSTSATQSDSRSAENDSSIRGVSEQESPETVAVGSNINSAPDTDNETPSEQSVDLVPSKALTETEREQRSAESIQNENVVAADDPTVVKSESVENKIATASSQNNSATAIARCSDGTYSYNKTRSGVCSYRGGVAEWLDGSKPSSSIPTAPRSINKSAGESTPATGRKFILGARGGCYYMSESGNKNYVDKSFCN